MSLFDNLSRSLFVKNDFGRFLHLLSNESICWYPSAGKDFSNILYWNRLRNFGIPEPDLYIHTGCDSTINLNEGKIIYKDNKTIISVDRMEEVSLDNPVLKVTLLEIKIQSTILGTFTKPVLFFHFENSNWFEEFAIRKGLKISHLFKVNEGCAVGGNLQGISSIYDLLNFIGCKYLIADKEVHFDPTLAETLSEIETLGKFHHRNKSVFAHQIKHFTVTNKKTFTTSKRNYEWALINNKGDNYKLWPNGEAQIATDPYYAYLYARDCIEGRWVGPSKKVAEANIATFPQYAYLYAADCIKGRWGGGEAGIKTAEANKTCHWLRRSKQHWGERLQATTEKRIAINPQYAYLYAADCIKGRWDGPLKARAEKAIATDTHSAYKYARDCIEGPWDGPSKEKAEARIATHPEYNKEYLLFIIQSFYDDSDFDELTDIAKAHPEHIVPLCRLVGKTWKTGHNILMRQRHDDRYQYDKEILNKFPDDIEETQTTTE